MKNRKNNILGFQYLFLKNIIKKYLIILFYIFLIFKNKINN